MYTVAITPILVGSLAAYAETGTLSISTFLSFLFSAIAIIAWLNLTNDVFDFDTGIDEHKAESIVNLCGKTRKARNTILAIAMVFLAIAFGTLTFLSNSNGQFDGTVLALISIAVFGGYAYQGPPFRLGYYGLGEFICFVTWILGVTAAYYSQIRADDVRYQAIISDYPTVLARVKVLLGDLLWSSEHYLCAAALLVAIPTSIILFCSHFHQLEDDRLAGKRSPIVRLGTSKASVCLQLSLLLFFVWELFLLAMKMIPTFVFFLSLLSVPQAWNLAAFVRKYHDKPSMVRSAKYYAVRFHFIHSCLISLGFYLVTGQQIGSW